ncbi:MAG: UV damage endonuclease UvsE [Candidatus Viridilinea halotolerans]|uniref:UV damage endonuclease UvsE n=1 Tax=Candidatus Viridilinea halotolerans TaxID=2491704 RepID=A0A426UBN6_9CHLR|nr:MAG: UV damage endonuclease UvsE [Candidatus Viridilinea halotolerans]
MIRLGFAVRALGRPGLVVGNGRSRLPDLSVGLVGLGDMLGYLRQVGVHFYRAALALPAQDGLQQLAACNEQIALLAQQLATADVRVSIHLPLGLALASSDAAQASAAIASIEATAALLASLDAARPAGGVEGIMVAHLGAPSAEAASYQRFALRYRALSWQARQRLALEHGSEGPSLGQLLVLHQQCGVPLVFDALHWALHNPEQIALDVALGLALATWPPNIRPEVHLSSQRGEAHLLPQRAGQAAQVLPPRPGQHADYVAFSELEQLLVAARGLPPFDLMLEAKAGDLALLRLRSTLVQRTPALAQRVR